MDRNDSRDIYGPLYGAGMLDLLGGPKVIWPSTIYADVYTTELPIWEQETQILPHFVPLTIVDDQGSRALWDLDTAPYSVALLPARAPVFPLRRLVARWGARRASA